MPVRTRVCVRLACGVLAAAPTLALAGCSAEDSGPAAAETRPGSQQPGRDGGSAPVPTTEKDWKPVADALDRTGTLMDKAVYRVSLPRKDLKVTSHDVEVKPGLALGGWAAFAKYGDGTMVTGDLVITEDEQPKVTDALQKAGIAQTALHKHLLEQSPAVWWTHIHGMGDPVRLAKGVKAALDTTGIPPASPAPSSQPPIDLDTSAIDSALGRKGTPDGGIYKFTVARKDPVTDGSHTLPAGLGVYTGINFQPLGGKKAAINGDFVTTTDEIQHVIRALRKGGIDLVELHNHTVDEQPRLFYLHFWATGDGVTLAKSLRPALDATHPAAPKH
ncbi:MULTISPECIES: DUF1259 domain-containing protein [unclassified Streptomyces]|uniref:DUF1259 domain-containing protein n=1 Tax=unclassified Streptomyces TaxID=2593676 RepID=UPI000996E1DB|nr:MULTISPECIES: DUF1259 domain-containing protein [unclassified Streptomyces]MYT27533.1 DUF1259 domain-containing protein [Streptomyces sp. SID8354]